MDRVSYVGGLLDVEFSRVDTGIDAPAAAYFESKPHLISLGFHLVTEATLRRRQGSRTKT
jgi:hypothetical protein